VVPMAHATDGGGSIRIPAGVNGNLGLPLTPAGMRIEPPPSVACAIGTTPEATAAADPAEVSIAPYGSDLTSVVSIQGCQSRTVRDTAVFVDQCWSGPSRRARSRTRRGRA
jgi:amidase